jgi:hypothetical protein
MTSDLGHAHAMEQQLWQCPQCPGGWAQYRVSEDAMVCPSCGYHGGVTKPDVSTGAICHVSLRIDAKEALAAHDGEIYRILEKMTDSKHDARFNKLAAEEQKLHDSVDAARKKINDLAAIGLHTLFSMGKEPVVNHSDQLELRLVLCRVAD